MYPFRYKEHTELQMRPEKNSEYSQNIKYTGKLIRMKHLISQWKLQNQSLEQCTSGSKRPVMHQQVVADTFKLSTLVAEAGRLL